MDNEKHNGWSNYPTWTVKSWMDNEYSSYHHEKELCRECSDVNELADRLKEEYEEINPVTSGTVWSDLMGYALSQVDWYEIAQEIWDDFHKDDEEETEEDEEEQSTGDD